jgi:HlyD family secretion protein
MSRLKPVLIGLILGLVILAGLIGVRATADIFGSDASAAEVKRGTVTETLNLTGKVKAVNGVDLSFERGGKVVMVGVKVGDKVSSGEILAATDASDLQAQLREAEANVKIQQARLDEVKRGARPEEIQIQETKAAGAEDALADAQKNLADKIADAYTKSDDAVRNKADQFFVNPRTASPKLSVLVFNSQLKTDLEFERLSLEGSLNSWPQEMDDMTAEQAQKNLGDVKSFLDNLALVVNAMNPNDQLPLATILVWRSDVSQSRANINTAIANLTAAEEKMEGAKTAAALADQELSLMKAGSTEEQISAQTGQLDYARAAADALRSQIDKTLIRAPFAGTITKCDANYGEMALPNVPLISVANEGRFEIEVSVPEADVARLKIGDPAKVTLDAYGPKIIFDAALTSLDSAPTIADGISVYKAKLAFAKDGDSRVKDGMTANVSVIAGTKENVLVIPRSALLQDNGAYSVMVRNGKSKTEKRDVQVGFFGYDGNTEILSGLKEGEKIIVY